VSFFGGAKRAVDGGLSNGDASAKARARRAQLRARVTVLCIASDQIVPPISGAPARTS
jgi:hypothetical protein